jgi:iron complex outermembrane recepter protein
MLLTKNSAWRLSGGTLLALIGYISLPATAQNNNVGHEHLEELVVHGEHEHMMHGTGDASEHLRKQGVVFSSAGGISSLPILHGMNDDRIKLLIDGATITSACGNHMNPALSYMDSSRVSVAEVIAGITPVSQGGDSIAGTIIIESEQPVFADSENSLHKSGSASAFNRSVNDNRGVAINLAVANQNTSLAYSGTYDAAGSYSDGNGNKVLDTLYRSESHSLTIGRKSDQSSMVLKFSHQKVPYQGFPNQYMDMVDNSSTGINLQYQRDTSWGKLETSLNYHGVDHEMGFFTDEKPGTMPMETEGRDFGYKIAGVLPTSTGSIQIGHEYQAFKTDDRWPAVPGSMMMGPNDYININDGERTRQAIYIEMENALAENWHTEMGIRYEHVVSDTGEVQAYSVSGMDMDDMRMDGMMGMNLDGPAAMQFNSRGRGRTDNNVDVTALAHYTFNSESQLELGYARKTRSPNLYERYTWGRSTMAMTMISWFGDANGYVGDIDLEPETAHTLSATFRWQNFAGAQLTASSYYTRINDYIDVQQIGTFNPRMAMQVTRPLLQFANTNANIYGMEIQGQMPLLNENGHELNLNSRLGYARGERDDNSGDLYNIMPLNLNLAFEHRYKNWTSTLEVEWVDRKKHRDTTRLEADTDAFALVDLELSYRWEKLALSLGLSNLFDRYYDLPLGGANYAGWLATDRSEQFGALPGEGRSVDVGIKYNF